MLVKVRTGDACREGRRPPACTSRHLHRSRPSTGVGPPPESALHRSRPSFLPQHATSAGAGLARKADVEEALELDAYGSGVVDLALLPSAEPIVTNDELLPFWGEKQSWARLDVLAAHPGGPKGSGEVRLVFLSCSCCCFFSLGLEGVGLVLPLAVPAATPASPTSSKEALGVNGGESSSMAASTSSPPPSVAPEEPLLLLGPRRPRFTALLAAAKLSLARSPRSLRAAAS